MILTGEQIKKEVIRGNITIDPFQEKFCNPNSYNFHLGDTVKTYIKYVLDPRTPNEFTEIQLPETGLVLSPNQLYLGHIKERIGSRTYVPIIKGLSSIGRLGLFINITADLIDLGAFGCWTLQMHCVQPMKIYPGQPIGQMTFWCIEGEPVYYEGKYQNATGPMQSLSYKDAFFK